jgi:hypothetical protein
MGKKVSRDRASLMPAEAHNLKAIVHGLSDLAAKQALYGLIQVLSFKSGVSGLMFSEVLDDARKYTEVKGVSV